MSSFRIHDKRIESSQLVTERIRKSSKQTRFIYKRVDLFIISVTRLINVSFQIMFKLSRLDPNDYKKKKKRITT